MTPRQSALDGAEVDPEIHRLGVERLSLPYTVTLDFGEAPKPEQTTLALGKPSTTAR